MPDPATTRIALIEDDPLVRAPLAHALHSAGYTVVSAATGPEGLDVLEDPKVALAVVDICLPGRLDGVDILREARRRNPALKAILTSGIEPDPGANDLGLFLPKPFRADQLVEAIRMLLDES